MKKKFWFYPLILLSVLFLFANSCKKDDTETNYPKIRLQSGTGLNNGAHIYFIALSKDDSFSNLSTDELFAYRKSNADWYLDGDVIPFVSEYKEFDKSIGEYYVLLSADGTVMTTKVTVLTGDQTFLISGSTFGGLNLKVVQP
jgi:hypothetical protein